MRAIRATSRSVECLKFQHVTAVKSDFTCGSVEMQAYVNYQFRGCKSSGNLVCALLLQEKKSYETLIKQDIYGSFMGIFGLCSHCPTSDLGNYTRYFPLCEHKLDESHIDHEFPQKK